MAQRSIPLARLMIGMYLIGVDRSWLQMPSIQQRFNIMDPSEIEARGLPLTSLDVVHEPEGERSIRDVRHAVRKGLNVEPVLRQVAA